MSFLSDVFGAGEPPGWLSSAAAMLPVKPLAGSLSGSLDEAGPDLGAGAVLVLMLWRIAATAVAWRRWSALTSS